MEKLEVEMKKQEIKITARELVMRGIDELVPYANNAKIHGEEQITKLRASLREFGFVTPVLIDEAGNIIAGHGRVINTSFVTGMGKYKIETAPELYEAILEEDTKNRKAGAAELPEYIYPPQVIRTVNQILSKRGERLCIKTEDALFVRHLDEQKALGKTIYGGGFLLSEKAAAEKAAAHVWSLSEREKALIAELGK